MVLIWTATSWPKQAEMETSFSLSWWNKTDSQRVKKLEKQIGKQTKTNNKKDKVLMIEF